MPRRQYPRKRTGKARGQRVAKIPTDTLRQANTTEGRAEQGGVAVNMPSTHHPSYVLKVVQRVMIKEEIKRTFSDGQTIESVETFPAVHQVWE